MEDIDIIFQYILEDRTYKIRNVSVTADLLNFLHGTLLGKT